MNNSVIGKTISNDIVTMSTNSLNNNIIFLGESGSGKTYAAMAYIVGVFKSFDKDNEGGDADE